ncbi:MAG: hypothetical protein NVSMB56_01010 [Pyrinomonadaceae bacterium]
MEAEKQSPAKTLIAVICFLVIFGIAYALVLRGYQTEGEKRSAVIEETNQKDPNRVEVSVRLVSVDFNKGDLSTRIDFTPHGNLTNDNSKTVNRALKLFVNGANGKREYDFAKGKRMNPIEVVVDLYDGQPSAYPFDKHQADLDLLLEAATKPKAATPNTNDESKGEDNEEDNDIPLSVNFNGSLHGLAIKAEKDSNAEPGSASIDIDLERAPTVKFFSTFIMLAMWCLTLGAVFLALRVAFGGRKIEVGMFSFMGALLFAFPALRNSQPGVPPIGSYSDFLAFFWAETIIALCLLIILTLWLVRPQTK